jgi:hypothetical protein
MRVPGPYRTLQSFFREIDVVDQQLVRLIQLRGTGLELFGPKDHVHHYL